MILSDTHAFVWTVARDRRLGPRAHAAVEPAMAVDSTRLPGNFHTGSADRAILSYAANGYLHALDAAA